MTLGIFSLVTHRFQVTMAGGNFLTLTTNWTLNQWFTNFFRCRKNKCNLPYIPSHLHQGNRPLISDFEDLEKLFWRLGNHNEQIPFAQISLFDVSCNRSGVPPNVISNESDVLWNTGPNFDFKRYTSKVVTLLIKKLFSNKPTKTLQYPEGVPASQAQSVVMTLIHDPLPCNYSHSMFVFDFNQERVTKENYNSSFGKSTYKRLRQVCRDELHKAILRSEIVF
jgi:hypothetical protein